MGSNEELKSHFDLTNPYEIARYIKAVSKTTPVKAYIKGSLDKKDLEGIEYYGHINSCIVFSEKDVIEKFLKDNKDKIDYYRLEYDRRNSAIPMLDITKLNSRIEPGALIREGVHIGDNCVIMMGA